MAQLALCVIGRQARFLVNVFFLSDKFEVLPDGSCLLLYKHS